MTTSTANIPGSLGDKIFMRQCLESLVAQKEQETSDVNENLGRGRWKDVAEQSDREVAKRDAYYKLALQNPGIVSWFCALRLEMLVHLTAHIISRNIGGDIVPGKSEATQAM